MQLFHRTSSGGFLLYSFLPSATLFPAQKWKVQHRLQHSQPTGNNISVLKKEKSALVCKHSEWVAEELGRLIKRPYALYCRCIRSPNCLFLRTHKSSSKNDCINLNFQFCLHGPSFDIFATFCITGKLKKLGFVHLCQSKNVNVK